jgi:hypothetical protein
VKSEEWERKIEDRERREREGRESLSKCRVTEKNHNLILHYI